MGNRNAEAEAVADEDHEIEMEISKIQREKLLMISNKNKAKEESEDSDEEDGSDEEEDFQNRTKKRLKQYTAPDAYLNDFNNRDDVNNATNEDLEQMQYEDSVFGKSKKIANRESEYQRRRFKRELSPERALKNTDDGDDQKRGYKDAMREAIIEREREETLRNIESKRVRESEEEERRKLIVSVRDDDDDDDDKREEEKNSRQKSKRKSRWDTAATATTNALDGNAVAVMKDDSAADTEKVREHVEREQRQRNARVARGWDDEDDDTLSESVGNKNKKKMNDSSNEWDDDDFDNNNNNNNNNNSNNNRKPKRNRWDDATPRNQAGSETPLMGAASEGGQTTQRRRNKSRWDETPRNDHFTHSVQQTPQYVNGNGSETPLVFGGASNAFMQTPARSTEFGGGNQQQIPMTPDQLKSARYDREMEERNKFMTDDDLDAILPGLPEYKTIEQPKNYVPLRTPARKAQFLTGGGQTPLGGSIGGGFQIPEENRSQMFDVPDVPEDLPTMKAEDYQYFAPLLKEIDEDSLSIEEQKERKIMKLLLKVKNGLPPQRKSALRQLTDKARDLGAGPLFNQILPLLMSPTLEDQERHLLVKVIDRILFKLDDLVRPYVHKILVVIEPLLIDEDYYARVEGREIIANLSKAAGLATMIAAMRPDIDNVDEYVRNTTARAFAVVAHALTIPALLPFLKAVCQSKKSWQARHTGVKIVQQIAILSGVAVLPHLTKLVNIIEQSLEDENQKVRTIAALAIAALAEASTPYGIESFDSVLKPLWKGIRAHRGKVLAAFLKAIGFIIPLMDPVYASYYTKEVMVILIREFASADEEMKKITLKVVKQCVQTDGVNAEYVRQEIMPPFFKNFWVRRTALDRRNYSALIETTLELAQKVGSSDIISKICEDLKDESEPFRRMVMECITKVVEHLGVADIDSRLEELLVDGVLYAFQEQTNDENDVMLNGFGTVANALGKRAKPYLPQICGTIKWRLNNKNQDIRQQAADLISKVAPVMKVCEEEQLTCHLGVVLYEYLGEEYPEVLGSILGALKSIVSVVGMSKMTPPVKDLLPRLTPILKNRHEKVQENCVDLVGRIADRGAEFVPAKEWMRICFELLEMLKAKKKSIRRASVNAFGYIAKAIGPQDVLATLLNNLKVQERQNRVCTTVAIAIVAETCAPFTVLPALMNEYRVPEINVQNGVLKSLAFLFEYIGEMGKDYIYAIAPLIEDALMDRDIVHRQTACVAVKHLLLGCARLNCEDAATHLMNFVWPNVFEQSPHVMNAVNEAIEASRVTLGPAYTFSHLAQGLFHPARMVRERYWRLYNSLYVGSQASLVAHYPRMKDDDENTYRRWELEMSL
jgi:splicing factor 3B subunit 1